MITILIIEDNLTEARLIHEQLNETGLSWFELIKANTLAKGLEIIQQKNIDVVLLDLGLPDVLNTFDGFTAILSKVNAPAVIIITNSKDDELASKIVSLGVQDYLVKAELEHGTIIKRSILHSIERKKILDELNQYKYNLEELVRQKIQELSETTDMFQALLEASPVGLFRATEDGTIVYVNDAWVEITGLDLENTNSHLFSIIHPEDKDVVLSAWKKILELNEEIDIEFRVFNAITQRETWVHSKARSHVKKGGFAGTIVNSKKDILNQLLTIKYT
jgi:PAS domain S-box-containing protein